MPQGARLWKGRCTWSLLVRVVESFKYLGAHMGSARNFLQLQSHRELLLPAALCMLWFRGRAR